MVAPDEQRRIGRSPTCTCGECRRCKHAAYMRAWYRKKSIDDRRAWVSRRDKDAVERAEKKRNRPPEHRERERARLTARRAIASGSLIKENCERCNSPFTQAHHEDYSYPLEVRWFCPYHHAERHRERVVEAGLSRD